MTSTSARLSLRGHEPRPALLEVEYRSPKTRITRALLTLLGFWLLAPLVAIIPPHIPWALLAFVAGIYLAVKQWTGEYVVQRFEGQCPRCETPLPLPPGTRIKLPHRMVCFQCHHEPLLQVDAGGGVPPAALLALLFLLPSCVPAARPVSAPGPSTLAAALDSVFADTALQHAHWGVLVKSLATGETLYQRDAGKAFVPASAMKLVTGAVALSTLGPDYRFRTTFAAAGPVRAGVLQGDLVVRGGGDPTLSERFSPDDARGAMRAWADSLRSRGITRIAGGIVGVDSAFSGAPLGAGWA
jgi:hypothetical protein